MNGEKIVKKEARNSGRLDGAGSASGSGGENSLIWIRHADSGEAKYEAAYFGLIDGYVKHLRKACTQNDYTVPRLKETRWLDHEGRMKLTFYSADNAEYTRKWSETRTWQRSTWSRRRGPGCPS